MRQILHKLFPRIAHCRTMVLDYDFEPIPLLEAKPERVHISVKDEESAMRYYDIFNQVVIAKRYTDIHEHPDMRFGLVLSTNPKNADEVVWSLKKVSYFKGYAIVRYDHLGGLNIVKRVVDRTAPLGLFPLLHLQEGTRKYVIFSRKDQLLVREGEDLYEFHKGVFTCPIIDIKQYAPEYTYHPYAGSECIWTEQESTDWKYRFFQQKITIDRSAKEYLMRERLQGGSIKALNKEQIAIALASGRVKKEVTLSDGRVFMFRGTERLHERESLKRGIDGKAEAVRVTYEKRATLIGLEMIRGQFVRFE